MFYANNTEGADQLVHMCNLTSAVHFPSLEKKIKLFARKPSMNYLVSVAEYAGFTFLDAGDEVSRDKAFILTGRVPVYEKQLFFQMLVITGLG